MMSHSTVTTLLLICLCKTLLCQTYPLLPVALSASAEAYQLQMTVGNSTTVVTAGYRAVFNTSFNFDNRVVTVAMSFSFDSTTTEYCPGCYRQILFGINGVQHDCKSFNPTTSSASNTLSLEYTSDGTPKIINTLEALMYNCEEAKNFVVNKQIGYIRGFTINPTANPTLSPTTANPTTNPTANPTTNPTANPTANPTFVPTPDPTTAPTAPPSSSPTFPPSHAPTNAPSESPTSCIDDDALIPSNDGIDIIYPIETNFYHANFSNNFYHTNSGNNNSAMYYVNNGFRSYINCNSTEDICYIQCNESASCAQSTITASNEYLSQLVIQCTEKHSCVESKLNITNIAINNVLIQCDGLEACDSMEVIMNNVYIDVFVVNCSAVDSCTSMIIQTASNINTTYVSQAFFLCLNENACKSIEYSITYVNVKEIGIVCLDKFACNHMSLSYDNIAFDGGLFIECMNSWSCNAMQIGLNTLNEDESENRYNYNTLIKCIEHNSCDNLLLSADEIIQININIYKYSNNINIIYTKPNDINMTCGNRKDHRFIRYNTNGLLKKEELVQLARNEYTNQRLPCDDIRVDCTKDIYTNRFCRMEYELNELNLAKFIKTRDYISCYWLEIKNAFNITCNGNCYHNITYYTYNESITFDVKFDINTNKSVLFEICNTYFGSDNNTYDTLNRIDAIFENVLTIVASTNPFAITEVLTSPYTVLRDESLHINCSKSFEIVKLRTNMSIRSGFQHQKDVDLMFNDESIFVNETQKLLAELFEVPISLKRITNKILKVDGFADHEVAVIVICVVVFMLGIISLIVIWIKHKNIKSMQIKNPLIVCITIGHYDESRTDREFNGFCQDLDGIEKDYKHIHDLFGQTYHFDIVPRYNDDDSIKQEWNKEELIELLNDCARKLATDDNKYDSLLTIISAHGIKDCIITSDYKLVKKDRIHRIFVSNYPSIRKLPRLFLFDVCDGDNIRLTEHRNDSIELSDEPDEEKSEFEDIQRQSTKNVACEIIRVNTVEVGANQWFAGEKNPDHRLAIINAANKNFLSWFSQNHGSLLIRTFAERVKENNKNGNKLFLSQIMDQIQDELENRKGSAQLIECKYNNKTGYIKFFERKTQKKAKYNKLKNHVNDSDNETDDNVNNTTKSVVELEEFKQNKHEYDETNEFTKTELNKLENIITNARHMENNINTLDQYGEEELLNKYILAKKLSSKPSVKKLKDDCDSMANEGTNNMKSTDSDLLNESSKDILIKQISEMDNDSQII